MAQQSLRAGYIGNIFAINGPGGTGSDNFIYDQNVITLNYTTVGAIGYTGTIYDPGSFAIQHEGIAKINNNTSQHWAGFRVDLAFFVFNGFAVNGGPSANGAFSNVWTDDDTIILSGGPGVDPGESFQFSFGFYMSAPGAVSISETPLVVVPEPGTLSTVAIAIMTSALYWRPRRKRQVSPSC
jgi:hypothetical protein